MSTLKEKVQSSFSPELVAEATTRAATDAPFKLALSMANKAGLTFGAAANHKDSIVFIKKLADAIIDPATYAAYVGGAITAQAVQIAQDESKQAAEDLASMEASATHTPEEIECQKTLTVECADKAHWLSEFRSLVALVNVTIKSAQASALASCSRENAQTERAKRSGAARARIVLMLKRQLKISGLEIDWQVASAEDIDVEIESAETPAQKAAKAIHAAFDAEPSAALAEICKIEGSVLSTLATLLAPIVKAYKAELATKLTQQNSESGAVVKGIHNHIKARREARLAAQGFTYTESDNDSEPTQNVG
jgi:hypothetical protein